ncbi:hypothetical protein C1646_713506 [Rhizophagus diaphanus]|nr:hypothetical protein C1646_713506 [Rhizophagus diaphanus] [Rhizophagus sp. MUCL 43196]
MNDYCSIVGINFRDFGITCAGFAYSYMNLNDIRIHIEWEGGPLSNEIAITNYLHELRKVLEQTIRSERQVDFYTQILFILTIPDKYTISNWTIRECAFKAGLLRDLYSQNLKFITESEAIAIFCMKYLITHDISVGENFMIIDCGGDIVNLTTRQLLENERLSLIAERIGNDCGSSSVDQEFLKFLENKVGSLAINYVKENRPDQIQYMVQVFFRLYKINFTGIQSEFNTVKFDSKAHRTALALYCNEECHNNKKGIEWSFELKFEDIKAIFDPIIDKIIQLIDSQLRLCDDNCFALSLVGDFGKSNYLQSRIKKEFNTRVRLISRPPYSVTAIMRGAVLYGLYHVNQNRIQNQLKNTIKELKEVKEKNEVLQDQILLYVNLQEEYKTLINKYNNETNQHQIVVKKLKSDIKVIEEKYQNQIIENQRYQNKIKLQEPRINQLQQDVKLKENQLKKLEKEKEELDNENGNLYQKNIYLLNQLENNFQQNILLDETSNYQSEDTNQNHISSLNNDILQLSDNLKKYITDLNQDVIVNMEEIKKLLLLYKCSIKITNQKDDQLLIQAVLQRHIIETILSYATKYFQSTGQHYHLEANIVNKASILSTLLTNISKYRTGNDEIAHVATTKLRQYIYSILNNCGFANIYGEDQITYEHPFIAYYKEELNNTMNELRIVKDQEKIASENLAAIIICEVTKIFWFRLKIHESVIQYVWIPCDIQVNEVFMEGNNFDDDNDNENLYVGLCYFPLIGRDLTSSNNREVYSLAKVFVQRNQHQI